MKLVQMPAELVHVELSDLTGRGVNPELLSALEAYAPRAAADTRGLALLRPREGGTAAALMVVARQVGAALRDENIRRRDSGDDMRVTKKQLCYLPGSAFSEALEDASVAGALTREAALFIQDLDSAGEAHLQQAFLALLAARHQAGLPTFISADPAHLSPDLLAAIQERLSVL